MHKRLLLQSGATNSTRIHTIATTGIPWEAAGSFGHANSQRIPQIRNATRRQRLWSASSSLPFLHLHRFRLPCLLLRLRHLLALRLRHLHRPPLLHFLLPKNARKWAAGSMFECLQTANSARKLRRLLAMSPMRRRSRPLARQNVTICFTATNKATRVCAATHMETSPQRKRFALLRTYSSAKTFLRPLRPTHPRIRLRIRRPRLPFSRIIPSRTRTASRTCLSTNARVRHPTSAGHWTSVQARPFLLDAVLSQR
jgi:hypothetical protein